MFFFFTFQLMIGVYDSALYRMVTFGNLNITMIRNPNPPVFNGTYRFNIEWRYQPGSVVGRVFATDLDNVSTFIVFCQL